MKNIVKISALLLGFGFSCIALHAQPPLKVVVVDMSRLYEGYYKTEEANAKFRSDQERANRQLEELNRQGQILVEQFNEMREQSENEMLTMQARERAAEDAARKFDEIQEMRAEVENYQVNTQRSLQQRVLTHRLLMLEEIGNVVREIARRRGATLVLDKSGPTGLGISNLVFFDPAYEITEEAMVEINRNRPAPETQPASDTRTPSTP